MSLILPKEHYSNNESQIIQVVGFLHRYIFHKANSRSRSKILGNDMTTRGLIIEQTRNTLPIVLQAALVPIFTRFCKFQDPFFAVLHTGGYYLSPKDSSKINPTRNMFWPQFLALCEHVKIIPALHVRFFFFIILTKTLRTLKYVITPRYEMLQMHFLQHHRVNITYREKFKFSTCLKSL